MEYNEKTVRSEKIFDGHVIKLRVDTVVLPNGKEATRELIEHPGGVAVLPVDSNNMVYLVRQYRKPVEKSLLEAPAGKLTPGEDHYVCGVRELKEETGFEAGEITYLGYAIPAPGYTNEIIHLYLARDLRAGEQTPDEDEFVDVEKYSFDDVVRMCINGEISDAKTVIAVMRAKDVI
ncbi:MAG: ADP-ribose pyrophosphatase [Firmicutes bacterium ADurb.Bin193]|nr:MAG: ADP-ribose pyrophosphatase [Firmicutes bacterium ADurb.Bin193]